MDSHEIPLALLEKLQDLLPVRSGFLRTLQLRHGGGVRAQDFANSHAGDPPFPRDLALAYLLRIQFQNRGALRLAQHAALAPIEVFRGCAGVVSQCAQSAGVPLRLAVDRVPWPPPPPVADAR